MGAVKLAIAAALLSGACIRPAEDRALADLDIGVAEAGGATFTVADGHASVRAAGSGNLALWGQAPSLRIDVALAPGAETTWDLRVFNAMPDAVLTAPANVTVIDEGNPRPAARRWTVVFDGVEDSAVLTIGSPDAAMRDPFRFAYMADIQTGVDHVADLFDRMNEDESIRFVVMGGDLTEDGGRDELDRVQLELERLQVPMFATIGNHELFGPDRVWEDLVGIRNFHFEFKGAHFTLVDSASATLDPWVYDRLDDWLDVARDEVHVLATHYPPFDPIGVRQGGFRSRKEAGKLFSLLAGGGVDTLFAGHIHSYYAFEVSGIPVYISGGGGADPKELLDGIDRHYLTVDVTPGLRIEQVGVVRID
jgi:predicted phosphodiesterase